jgi:hypothetical protein
MLNSTYFENRNYKDMAHNGGFGGLRAELYFAFYARIELMKWILIFLIIFNNLVRPCGLRGVRSLSKGMNVAYFRGCKVIYQK